MTEYNPTSDKVVHVTYADLSARNIIRPVHLVQYDSGIPILAVKLYNDGQVYTIPNEANVNIRYNKADGKKVYNPSLGKDSTGHIVYFEMTQQMTAVCGESIFVVEIEKNNEIASSGSISIIIDRNPIQEENIRSSNEYITAKQYAEQAVDAAAKSASSANQAAEYANTANSKASVLTY